MARCLALLGMVATHVLADRDAQGGLTLGHAVAGGRASALFAVLAGVSLALMTGGREPVTGAARRAVSGGLAVRALLIALIGLLLGGLGSGLAVILTNYGLLFLLALAFVGLRPRTLFTLAGVWVVALPVLSQLLRPLLPERDFASPAFAHLADPGRLLSELLFTGYYPVLPWLAYLLVGLGLGRLDLRSRRTQGVVVATGALVAAVSLVGSRVLTGRQEVLEALLSDAPETTGPALLDQISGGMFGNTPTGGAWQWLLVVAPHSTTPFDLAHTIGAALLVIGVVLLVVGLLPEPGRVFAAVLFGAGTMTLTLYSLHVFTRSSPVWPANPTDSYLVQALMLLAIGSAHVAGGARGPLERLVGAASSRASQRLGPG